MGLLQAFLDRYSGKANVEPTVATAVSDDGSGSAIDAGKPSPLRADATTGALKVTAAGGSGGTVAQGTGSAASPWGVQGVNGGALERLATRADQATAQTTFSALLTLLGPASIQAVPQTPKTVPTGAAEAIVGSSVPATRFVRVTSDFANKKTIYVGDSTVTTVNGQPLGAGDTYTSPVDNANKVYCISADAAQVLRIEVL